MKYNVSNSTLYHSKVSYQSHPISQEKRFMSQETQLSYGETKVASLKTRLELVSQKNHKLWGHNRPLSKEISFLTCQSINSAPWMTIQC